MTYSPRRYKTTPGFFKIKKHNSEMSNQQQGRILEIGELERIPTQSGKEFLKRKLVLQTESQYPEEIAFEFVQAHVDIPLTFQAGETVIVYFDLTGRKWQDKHFVGARGWKIERVGGEQPQPQAAQSAPQAAPAPAKDDADDIFGNNDQLPF